MEADTKVQKPQEKCCGHVCASSYQKGHLTRQGEKEYFNNLGFFKALRRYTENGNSKVCPPPGPSLRSPTANCAGQVLSFPVQARHLLWSRKDASLSPSLSSFYLQACLRQLIKADPRMVLEVTIADDKSVFSSPLSPLWLLLLCPSCISELTAKTPKEHPHSSNKGASPIRLSQFNMSF